MTDNKPMVSQPEQPTLRQNQRGVALLLAVFVMVIMTYLVTEVSYETNVEYQANANSVERLRAYYAAKAGVELSLLRIQIYKKIKAQFGKQMGAQSKMLDMIWSMPLSWPPDLPSETNAVEKDMLTEVVGNSLMDAKFTMSIADEGSKIDLNDLASKSPKLAEITRKQLLGIFENADKNDPKFHEKYQDLKQFEVLVNNIADWIDDDQESKNGGSEAQYYSDFKTDKLPPNRAFRTLDEVRMVAGMSDDIFEFLKPAITVYGARAINVNYAGSEILKSLDPSFTDAVVGEIIKRRNDDQLGGQYSSPDDFWNFAQRSGAQITDEMRKNIPLIFDSVKNFRIRAIGLSKNVTHEIDVITFDLPEAAKAIFASIPTTTLPPPDGRTTTTLAPTTTIAQNVVPKGAPRVVYWNEK
jgi:general secretion pathway protein K